MTETSHASANGGAPSEETSLGNLVALASRDLSLLVHKEIELAKAELAVDVKRAGLGAGFLGSSGLFAHLCVVFASVAAAFGLHAVGLGLGWSFLIVSGAYLLAGAAAAAAGARSLKRVGPPRRTIETVKDDIAWARHPRQDPIGE